MKNIILFPVFLICISTYSQLSLNQLEIVDGVAIKKGESSPYSGLCKGTYKDGSKYEGKFKKGLKVKLWKEWYETDMPKSEIEYKNGLKEGEGKYDYAHGQIKEQGEYEDNRRVGTWTEWGQYGKNSREVEYKTEIKEENDVRIVIGTYKNGKKHDLLF